MSASQIASGTASGLPPARRRPNVLRWAVFGIVALSAAISLWMAVEVFPLPSHDSGAYALAALNLRQQGRLVNPSWEVCASFDPTGEARFLQYPPGFPVALAGLLPVADGRGVWIVLSGLSIATLLAFALGILRDSSGAGPWSGGLKVAATLALTPMLTAQATGRPDVLASFVVTAAAVVLPRLGADFRLGGMALGLGLLGLVQPVAAALGALACALWLSQERKGLRWLRALGVLALGASGLVLVGLLLAGRCTPEFWAGLVSHARVAVLPAEPSSLLYYYLGQPHYFFFGSIYLWALAFLLRESANAGWEHRLSLAGLLVVCWYFGLRSPNRSYNLLLFAPVVFLYVDQRAAAGNSALPPLLRRPALALLGAAFLTCALGFARQALVFQAHLQNGFSYDAARQSFSQRALASTANLTTTVSLWPLADNPLRVRLLSDMPSGKTPLPVLPGGQLLFLQQAYSGLDVPPSLPGFRLEWHNFRTQEVRFGGLRLASGSPGYAYAVYRRLPAEAEPSRNP